MSCGVRERLNVMWCEREVNVMWCEREAVRET